MVFEAVFLLEKSYKVPKANVREKITAVIALRGFALAEKALCLEVLDLYVEKNISYADAYNAAWMLAHGVSEVYSWDREFDRVPDLVRIEP